MKIVLDTNVLVAGLLSPWGPCAQILRMISSGELSLCLDARILSEYDEVLRRPKFGFRIDRVVALVDHIEHSGVLVASSPLSDPLPDPDDHPFLEVARAGQAACLVTGNHAHFPTRQCRGTKVLSPGDFLTFHRKKRRTDP
ncbi:MAG: putative toxin-antitoxin system toxin component, PIN family [Planctomycetes bacterium]|nr:putative toxin-antitoxin system toxin component, PIN family [Planctomycetota bacterium]